VKIGKKALSGYLRSGCDRRLALTVASDAERQAKTMPPEQDPRPGLPAITKAGVEWEKAKLGELEAACSKAVVASKSASGAYNDIDLAQSLATGARKHTPAAGVWLFQPQYAMTPTYLAAVGCKLPPGTEFADLRPDVIEMCPTRVEGQEVQPDGTMVDRDAHTDPRIPLRVIDIKLSSQPGAGYFGEVVMYAMALSAWLKETNQDIDFVVIDDCAVWPGGYGVSKIAAAGAAASYADVRAALKGDLESAPFGVFAPEIRRLFAEHIPRVTVGNWQDLDYHVDSSCSSCPFVGTTWSTGNTSHPLHCVNEARTRGHLSRVADVTRGARVTLTRGQVPTVADLAAATPSDAVFGEHQSLRSSRAVLPQRAAALGNNGPASLAPWTGTSAQLPGWADLHLHVTAHFDASSAITLALGMDAFGFDLLNAGRARTPANPQVWINNAKSLQTEWDDCVLPFLTAVDTILKWMMSAHRAKPALDANGRPKQIPTLQIYVWDQLERKHLGRIISRHLQTILLHPNLAKVVWTFLPSEEQVANPNTVHPSPVTILSDVVRTRLVAPIPHRYSLLEVAKVYHPATVTDPARLFFVKDLYQDPLSDQIPSERAHDIWAVPASGRRGQYMGDIDKTVHARLRALASVRQRLTQDIKQGAAGGVAGLAPLDSQAPRIDVRAPSVPNAALTSQLWYLHALVNAALDEQEAADVRAMPAHEREARHRSIRVTNELDPSASRAELQRLFPHGPVPPNARVYRVRAGSEEAKIKAGALGFAIAPERAAGILEVKLGKLCAQHGIALPSTLEGWGPGTKLKELLEVNIHAFDRQARVLVVSINDFKSASIKWPNVIGDLESQGALDLEAECVIDPVPKDYLKKKLEGALAAHGNPPAAIAAAPSGLNIAVSRSRLPPPSTGLPGGDLLWSPATLAAATSGRSHTAATPSAASLNPSQAKAWAAALDRRLSIVWGPPGTGKTHTLRAIIVGLALDAAARGSRLRIGVGASTYNAVDEVLRGLPAAMDAHLQPGAVEFWRLRSDRADASTDPRVRDVICGWKQSSPVTLFGHLTTPGVGIDVVGINPHQAINLIKHGGPHYGHGTNKKPRYDAELFDVLIVDEASQLDVAHTSLLAATLAPGFSAIIAGDDKQMPPIHPSDPPIGLERWVGSFLEYLRYVHGTHPQMLETNYRSNKTVVGVSYMAGYPNALTANSPDLAVRYQSSGGQRDWRDEVLDPARPVTVLSYNDQAASSQWNPFEALVVEELIVRLRKNLLDGLANEFDYQGAPVATRPTLMTARQFFASGVGIVTPHRAQMALIANRLISRTSVLQHGPGDVLDHADIINAVDTVERFQGQQRDVIVMSYALGDVDSIRTEEEFLLSLRRFNVAASRARAKLVVVVSDQVLHHLATEIDVLRSSDLLKRYAFEYCDQSMPVTIPDGSGGHVDVKLKWRA
jgi:DNA replication ATP-dependent helicase Dna2